MCKKIAVLGSCVTRDIFNSKFNQGYKKYFDCILTQNQTSIISLMSNPIPLDETKIDNLNDYDIWNVRTEFTKEFISLLSENPPDYIIIDFFADIHFGVLKLNNEQYITNNRWKLWKTSFYNELQNKEVLKFETHIDDYIALWVSSIDKFFSYINNTLPSTKIIINKSKFVDYYLTSNDQKLQQLSESGKCAKVNVEQSNFIWEHLNNHILEEYNVEYLDMSKKEYVSFEDHPWGPFYVHYSLDYYSDALEELIKITGNNTLGK